MQEKVNALWANAKLFDKGIKLFAGKSDTIRLLSFVVTSLMNLIIFVLPLTKDKLFKVI